MFFRTKVLDAISDDKSWALFSAIAIRSLDSNGQQSGDGGQILVLSLNLTRKQFYQRINRLRSLGLINRNKGKYCLSSFGRILFEIQETIETAIQNRWRFVALDSLESSVNAERMPVEDRIKLVNILLADNDEIRNILLRATKKGGAHSRRVPL